MGDITKEKKLEIEQVTESILEEFKSAQSFPVDIAAIVKKAGFEVEPTDMPIDTTGCLLVNDQEKEKKRLIKVNTIFRNPDNEEDVVFKKSRFITAHEYGHYKLHKPQDQPLYAHRDSDKRDEPMEMEADYFARSVLMPLEQFKVYYQVLNEMGNNNETFTIEMLSQLFKVTRNKAAKRVEDLLELS